ncbi:MAG TPA: hypothetical protein VMZ71_17410 [Gemmataceae bacterium]|nr:hypothetical protein [Gemmataceae bacterium]
MRILSAQKKASNCVAFSPDGTRLAEAAHGGAVRVWNLASGEAERSFAVKGLYANQMRLAFSPDGATLAAAVGNVVLLDLAAGTQQRLRTGGTGFCGVAFPPDGKQLVAAGDSLARWDTAGDEAIDRPLPKMNLPVPRGFTLVGWPACAFSADGTRFAVSRRISIVVGDYWRNTEQILIHDPQADAVVARFEWTGHHAHRVAFSPDSTLVAAACGPVLRVWDAESQALVAERKLGTLHVMGLAFSPDGRHLATVSKDRTTRFWPTGNWGDAKTYEWDVGKLLDVAFSPDGTTAAVSSDKGKIVLFDVD